MRELDLSEPEGGAHDTWAALARKALGLAADVALPVRTADGLPLLAARPDWPLRDASGAPGAAPFTRGTHAETNGRWDIRAICAEPDPAKANAEVLEDLAGGATSVWLSGWSHTARWTRSQFARALRDAPPAPFAIDAGSAAYARRFLGAIGDARAVALFLNLDAFATAARGLASSLDKSLSDCATMAARLAATSPDSRAIGIDTRPYHNAGATRVQELGIALASGVAYLRALTDNGLDIATAARQIAFILVTDANFIPSIAKLRAFRRTWARVLEACGTADSMREVHVTAVTSQRMMTRRDPYTNILRTAAATFAAATGGADAIAVLPFTSRLGIPNAHARRIARNTQNILMEEAQLARVIDPAGGAFGIEQFTQDLAQQAWGEFQAIEAHGGMAAAPDGFIRSRIAPSWEAERKRIALRVDVITGVTDFPLLAEPFVDSAPATGRVRLVPMKAVDPLPVHTLDEEFEALRAASDAAFEAHGERPKIHLLRIGSEIDCVERAAFARSLFEAGGIQTVLGDLTENAQDAASAFLDSGIRIAALVSSDAQYERHALAFTHEAKQAGARYLYFVGTPGDLEQPLIDAGVDAFIDRGIDAIETLQRLHIVLGLGP
jgi:methylmalonyl-CoA mutase